MKSVLGWIAGLLLVGILAGLIAMNVAQTYYPDGPVHLFFIRLIKKDMQIFVDAQSVQFSVRPVWRSKDTLIEAEPFMKALGASYQFDPVRRQITAKLGANEVIMHLYLKDAFINGRKDRFVEYPILAEGQVMVPLKEVSSALGLGIPVDEVERVATYWSPAWKAAHPDTSGSTAGTQSRRAPSGSTGSTGSTGSIGSSGSTGQPGTCNVNYGYFTFTNSLPSYIRINGQAYAVPFYNLRLPAGTYRLELVNHANQVYSTSNLTIRPCGQSRYG